MSRELNPIFFVPEAIMHRSLRILAASSAIPPLLLGRLAAICVLGAICGTTFSHAQGPTPGNIQGVPAYVPFDGDRVERVDTSSGNLHIEIPVYTEVYRGHTYTWKYVYDTQGFSSIWVSGNNPNYPGQGYYMIAYPTVDQSASWRFVDPFAYTFNYDMSPAVGMPTENCHLETLMVGALWGHYWSYQNFSISEPDGTQHPIDATIYEGYADTNTTGEVNMTPYPISPCDQSIYTGYATDGSGIAYDMLAGIVRLKDGTVIHVNNNPYAPTNVWTFEDPNGNLQPNGTRLFYDAEGNAHTVSTPGVAVPIVESDCSSGAFPVDGSCVDLPPGGSISEISSIGLPNGQTYSFTYNMSGHAEMTGMTMPTGASVAYTYGPMFYDNNPTRYATQSYHPSVATRTITSDGTSLQWQYNIASSYSQGAFPGQPTVKDPSGNCTGYGFVSLGLPTVVSDVYTYNGCNTSQVLKHVHTDYYYNDQAGRTNQNGSLVCVPGSPCDNVRPIRVTTTLDNGISSKVETDYEMFTGVASFPYTRSNPSQIREYDFGATTPTRITNYTYLHNVGNATASAAQYTALNIVDKPATKIVTDGAGNVLAQTNYEYDNYTNGILYQNSASAHDDTNYSSSNLIRGNLTAISEWNNAAGTNGTWLTTRYQYDDLGNIVAVTDPNNKTTTLSYTDSFADSVCLPTDGSMYSVPTLVTNPKGQPLAAKYSSCNGFVKQIQNANDLAQGRNGTAYSFDSVSNLINVSYPDGGRTSYNFYGYANPLTMTTSVYPDGIDPVSTTVQMDQRGRKSIVTNPDGSTSTTTYDNSSRVASVSNFHTSTPASTDGTIFYTYDSLDRPVYVCNQDNGAVCGGSPLGASYKYYSYTGNQTYMTDEVGNQWEHVTDGLGRLTQVFEPGPTTQTPTLQTAYTYDPLSNLKTVTQYGNGVELQRTRSFNYDSLSRLLSASNPETGTVSYSYINGTTLCAGSPSLPCSKTDARGIVTNYAYDSTNFLTSKTYSSDPTGTASSCYEYDISSTGATGGNFIGHLTGEWTQAGACPGAPPVTGVLTERLITLYDAMGRIKNEQQCGSLGNCPGSSPYTPAYTYDYAGNLVTSSNGVSAQPITLNLSYDTANRLKLVTSSWADSGPHPPTLFEADSTSQSAPAYGPYGLENATLGVNIANTASPVAVSMNRSYDNRLRLLSETDLGNGSLLTGGSTTAGTKSAGSITIGGTEGSATGPGTKSNGFIEIDGAENEDVPANGDGPDSGEIYVTINGVTEEYDWGDGDDTGSISQGLVAAINADPAQQVVANELYNSVVNLTSKTTGSATNYTISASSHGDYREPQISFQASASGSTMTGGAATTTIPDTGSISVTINDATAVVPWQSGSTAQAIATQLQSQLQQAGGGFLQVTRSGSTLSLSSSIASADANWPILYSITDTSSQTPSFTLSDTGMSGASNPTVVAPTVSPGATLLYSYSIPAFNPTNMAASGYLANGNLQNVTDSVMGNWSYQYDDLNRLKQANASANPQTGFAPYGAAQLNWGYDSFGDYKGTTLSGTTGFTMPQVAYSYNGSSLQNGTVLTGVANNRIDGYNYDASGDLLSDPLGGSYYYTYDAEGRVSTVGSSVKYVYDAEGRRVAKESVSGGSATVTNQYVLGLGGEQVSELNGSGSWVHSNVFASGKLLATYNSAGLHFHFTDWLGTNRIQTSGTGTLEESCLSLPYSDMLSCSGSDSTEQHFTGQIHDAESGLDYFSARYYQSSAGRFMSPDWNSNPDEIPYADIRNPQSLNLYGYVKNNPLRQADPDGHCCVEEEEATETGAEIGAEIGTFIEPGGGTAVGGVIGGVVGLGLGIYADYKIAHYMMGKGGRQNHSESDFEHYSDDELNKMLKDPTTSVNDREKIVREQKARATRNAAKRGAKKPKAEPVKNDPASVRARQQQQAKPAPTLVPTPTPPPPDPPKPPKDKHGEPS